MALKKQVPLFVCFSLPSKYLNATFRQYDFMIKGLQEVEKVQCLSMFCSLFIRFTGSCNAYIHAIDVRKNIIYIYD